MYTNRFALGSDYKTEFSAAVTELLAVDMPTPWRMKAVDDLVDAYVKQTGERPDGRQVERLTDYILKDELTDPHADKVTNTEYPILSAVQLSRRTGRELSSGELVGHTANTSHKLKGKRKAFSVQGDTTA